MLKHYRIKRSLKKSLSCLAISQNVFFSLYLSPHQQDDNSLLIKKFYQQRLAFLAELHFLRKFSDQKAVTILVQHLEQLFDTLCSMHLLRFRVEQSSLFTMGHRELNALKQSSVELLMTAAKTCTLRSFHANPERCLVDVENVETLYLGTLQVVAPDPLAFQLFIKDCYAFCALMERC